MFDEAKLQSQQDEKERNAYNLAFHELDLNWHWDSSTYDRLLHKSTDPTERLHHYLETTQPHLLRAYDRDFLVTLIEQKKAVCVSNRW